MCVFERFTDWTLNKANHKDHWCNIHTQSSRRSVNIFTNLGAGARIVAYWKGHVPKTRKFKLYAHSEEFTSYKGSPKKHFNQKMRKNF